MNRQKTKKLSSCGGHSPNLADQFPHARADVTYHLVSFQRSNGLIPFAGWSKAVMVNFYANLHRCTERRRHRNSESARRAPRDSPLLHHAQRAVLACLRTGAGSDDNFFMARQGSSAPKPRGCLSDRCRRQLQRREPVPATSAAVSSDGLNSVVPRSDGNLYVPQARCPAYNDFGSISRMALDGELQHSSTRSARADGYEPSYAVW